MPRRFDTSKFGLDHLKATAEKCKNWGRWGADDEIGTLNFITPESIAGAARLIRRGKVFSLGLNFDRKGPQRGLCDDCAQDRVYEFFFCGPPLPITGAVGSPINPQAIK